MYEPDKDVIVYNGERSLIGAPIFQRVEACAPPVPLDHPRVVKSKRPIAVIGGPMRSYVATWEIKDGRVYLVELTGEYRLGGNEPLFADWFSGDMVFPTCGVVSEPTSFGGFIGGHDIVFKKEATAVVERGIVIKLEVKDLQNLGLNLQ